MSAEFLSIRESRPETRTSAPRCAAVPATGAKHGQTSKSSWGRKSQDFILWIEGIGFGILIAVSWAAELVGLPYLLFSDAHTLNWSRPMLRTIVILSVWAPVHLVTRSLLKRLHYLEEFMLVCGWCRKIGYDGEWITTADYFKSAHATPTSHGICPECSRAFNATEAVPESDPAGQAEGI